MSAPRGTLEEVRSTIFTAKEARRSVDAHASPEEKLLMLEVMQELTRELVTARSTLKQRKGAEGRYTGQGYIANDFDAHLKDIEDDFYEGKP